MVTLLLHYCSELRLGAAAHTHYSLMWGKLFASHWKIHIEWKHGQTFFGHGIQMQNKDSVFISHSPNSQFMLREGNHWMIWSLLQLNTYLWKPLNSSATLCNLLHSAVEPHFSKVLTFFLHSFWNGKWDQTPLLLKLVADSHFFSQQVSNCGSHWQYEYLRK